MDATIATYEDRLAALANTVINDRAGPVTADEAIALAGELHAAHKQSVRERDKLASILYRQHGATPTALCVAIFGRDTKVDRVRKAIEAVPKPPRMAKARAERELAATVERAGRLWDLYKQARGYADQLADLAKAEPEPPALTLPDDLRERAQVTSERVREVKARQQQLHDARNAAAAALVRFAGWSTRNAAQLAGTDARHIMNAKAAAVAGDADPQRVLELKAEARQIGAERRALTQARDEAIRALAATMGPAELSRLVDMADATVIGVRNS